MSGTYAYDVFGPIRAHTGVSTQWSFTGEQNDANGLEYLRARYYDPATGRFLSRDPIPFIQRYAYVGNNPVNWTDPYGLCWGPDWVCDKAADFKDWGTDVYNHPASVIQITAGTAVALTSWGDRSRQDGVTFYENCGGSCSFLKLIEPEAITLGHDVFAENTLDETLITHELAHVRQGDQYGLLWFPSYVREQLRHGYACNRFEEEARRAAGQRSQCPGPGKE